MLHTRYDHWPGRLVDTWSDATFLAYKFARLGQRMLSAGSHVERTPAGRFIVIDSHYQVPALRPGRLTGTGALFMEVRQRDVWPEGEALDERDGVWQLNVTGLPVALGGRLHLRPRRSGPGAYLSVRVTADADRLPLLGSPLEGFATWMVRQTLHRIPVVTHAWIERDHAGPDAAQGTVDLTTRPPRGAHHPTGRRPGTAPEGKPARRA